MNGKKARQIRKVAAQMGELAYAKQRLWGDWNNQDAMRRIPRVTARRFAAGADKVLKKAYRRGLCRIYQVKLEGGLAYGISWA